MCEQRAPQSVDDVSGSPGEGQVPVARREVAALPAARTGFGQEIIGANFFLKCYIFVHFQRSAAVTYPLLQVAGRSATVTSRRWVVTRASTRGSWSVLETCGRDRSVVAARRIER